MKYIQLDNNNNNNNNNNNRAHLSVKVEAGYGLSRDHINSRPADILVQSWDRGKPAAFDVTVASPLTPAVLNEASISAGAAAYGAENRKHATNDIGAWLANASVGLQKQKWLISLNLISLEWHVLLGLKRSSTA